MALLLVTAMCELNSFFFFCAGERDEGWSRGRLGENKIGWGGKEGRGEKNQIETQSGSQSRETMRVLKGTFAECSYTFNLMKG